MVIMICVALIVLPTQVSSIENMNRKRKVNQVPEWVVIFKDASKNALIKTFDRRPFMHEYEKDSFPLIDCAAQSRKKDFVGFTELWNQTIINK